MRSSPRAGAWGLLTPCTAFLPLLLHAELSRCRDHLPCCWAGWGAEADPRSLPHLRGGLKCMCRGVSIHQSMEPGQRRLRVTQSSRETEPGLGRIQETVCILSPMARVCALLEFRAREFRRPTGNLDCRVISHGIRRERLEGQGCSPVSSVCRTHTRLGSNTA